MSNALGHSYFRQDGEMFQGLDPVRGPWSPEHCHAGPVAALTARAAEAIAPSKMQITRLTLDLIRPIPVAGFAVTAEIVRQSRSLTTTSVAVIQPDGKPCATGTTMHMLPVDQGDLPTAPVPPPELEQAKPDMFPLSRAHDVPGFIDHADIIYPPGQGPSVGPKTVWMRFPAIVEGEAPSPFQRLCPLADSTNGISGNSTLYKATFLNTDLSIHMHRQPQGAWIGSEARSHWQSDGIGLGEAVLYDHAGPVAAALQTLMIRRR